MAEEQNAPPAGDSPPADPKPVPKYTDEDVNNLTVKAKAEAVAGMLKDLGVESTGKLKEDLKTLKDIQDKGKTEAERLAAQAKEFETGKQAAEAEAMAVKTENAALKAGVQADKVDRFVKLAAGYEGTPAERVAAAIKDFPEFKGQASGGQSFGAHSRDQGADDKATMTAELEKAMGLKKRV